LERDGGVLVEVCVCGAFLPLDIAALIWERSEYETIAELGFGNLTNGKEERGWHRSIV
jgi:hypothetical protein